MNHKQFKEAQYAASKAVDESIDHVNAAPKGYGGHAEKNMSSVCDGVAARGGFYVLHDDGRVGRLLLGQQPNGRNEPNACTVRFTGDIVRVVAARKLRHLT